MTSSYRTEKEIATMARIPNPIPLIPSEDVTITMYHGDDDVPYKTLGEARDASVRFLEDNLTIACTVGGAIDVPSIVANIDKVGTWANRLAALYKLVP